MEWYLLRVTMILVAWLATASLALAQTTVEYIHTDALGSPVAVTNQAGQVIERNDYEPYGAMIGKPDYQGIGYTGHVQDAATGLTYMQQRYYDPQVGMLLSVDPVTPYQQPVTNFCRYCYAQNNPHKFSDPDGRNARDHRSIAFRSPSFESSGGGDVGKSTNGAQVAHNGRDKGVPIQRGTSQIRYDAANRAVDQVRQGVERIPHSSPDEAARTFNAMLQPIVQKYGLEIEATINSSVERHRLDGIVVGDRFRKDGIGFTVNSPSYGQSTVHGHPLSTFERNGYRPFSSGDLNWYQSSPGVPHFVTNPEGIFRYDGASKPVIKVD